MALVTWRDGVHLTGTPIWCDARRRRDICFVSSADRVGRAGHGQLIATPSTLALLGARGDGHLGVPLHQRFTLGTVRLELIASGRGPGGAALHVDLGTGKTVLYAGAVRPAAVDAARVAAAEARAASAVVVAAPFGEPRHRFPPLADAIAATLAWTRAQLAADRRPVLLVDAALDGLEVAMCLAAAAIPVAGGRPIRDLALRANEHRDLVPSAAMPSAAMPSAAMPSAAMPSAAGELQLATPGREPRAIVWLDSDRTGLARALGGRPATTALISGRAVDGDTHTDAAFAWAHAADREQLLAWIEATRADDVFVTGACAETIAAALGPRARVVGPPHQMSLFPREAVP